MPLGLQKRGSTYWLRRRVPKELVEAYGKAEISKSLRTKDRTEAKRRLVDETYALEKEFDETRASLLHQAPEPQQPDAAPATSRLQRLRGASAPPPNLLKTILDRSEGFDAELQRRGRIPATPTAPSEAQSRQDSISWARLTDRWASERQPTEKTRKAHEAVAAQFRQIVAKDPEFIGKADVLLFKESLVKDGMSPANLRTKLSRLKTLINYGHENGLVRERAADGVRIAKSKFKARVPFDDQSLQRLFNGPVHQEGLRPTQGRGEASFWLPLIALYAGARLEEVAGLRVDDLIELTFEAEDRSQQTAWFFRFLPDPMRSRTLKTDDSERTTPIHPELIRLGLLRYRQAVIAEGETQLFPRLTMHRTGKRAHKWGQWFGTYLRKSCGVGDKRTVFHSFRHTLKDAGRECGVTEELQRAIMGHSAKDIAGSYGLGFSRRRIVEGMNQIRIPGLPTIVPASYSDVGDLD